MAIASIGTRGTQVSGASSTTIGRAPTATVAAGRCLVAHFATREDVDISTVTDTAGNTWEFVSRYSHVGTGDAHNEVWLCNVTDQLTTGTTITATFNSAVVDACMALWEFEVDPGSILQVVEPVVGNQVDAANGFGAASFAGLPSRERLYFRSGSKRANSTGTITATSGYTTHALNIRSRNSATLAIVLRSEHLIATSTGTTSNPTFAVSGNTAANFVAFEEYSPPVAVDLTGNSVAQTNTSTDGAVVQTHVLTGNSVAQTNTSTNGAVTSGPLAVDLTGNSVAQDNTSSAGAVVQTHILTGNSVAQTNTSTTGAVVQTYALAGNSVAQTNTANTGAVTQTHTLTGNSAAQVNTSTDGPVSQTPTYFLTGNSAAQVNTSTAGGVSQTHTLTGSSAAQPNTSTTGAVAHTHVLTGASAAQPNTSNTGTAAQTHVLTGASAAQVNTSTTGSLSQALTLTGNSAVQPNTSTSGAVTQTFTLTGNSVGQSNTSSAGAVAQVHVLTGNPVAVDNVATSSAIVQTHILRGDWVEPGWIESGWVLTSSSAQVNTSTSGAAFYLSQDPSIYKASVEAIANRVLAPTIENAVSVDAGDFGVSL